MKIRLREIYKYCKRVFEHSKSVQELTILRARYRVLQDKYNIAQTNTYKSFDKGDWDNYNIYMSEMQSLQHMINIEIYGDLLDVNESDDPDGPGWVCVDDCGWEQAAQYPEPPYTPLPCQCCWDYECPKCGCAVVMK